jgi:hypothetical protein
MSKVQGSLVRGVYGNRDTPAFSDPRRVSSKAKSLMNLARKLWRNPDRILGIVGGFWSRSSRQYVTNINSRWTTCCCVDSAQWTTASVGLWCHTCMNTVHFFHALAYVYSIAARQLRSHLTLNANKGLHVFVVNYFQRLFLLLFDSTTVYRDILDLILNLSDTYNKNSSDSWDSNTTNYWSISEIDCIENSRVNGGHKIF